ncbi:MAG: hypothetical protein ABSB82_17205 [Terriglobia bacterium]
MHHGGSAAARNPVKLETRNWKLENRKNRKLETRNWNIASFHAFASLSTSFRFSIFLSVSAARSRFAGPLAIVFLATALPLIVPSIGASQQETELTLKEKIIRKGVFFRADAPYVLRNQQDSFLPLSLEIINGIEKCGHSTAAMLAKYLTRDPIRLEGVNLYVKPVGSQHHFSQEPLLLGSSADFSFDARAGGQPLEIPERLKKTLEIPLAAIRLYLEQHYVGGPYDNIDLEASFHAIGWPSQNFFLRVRLNAAPLPELPGWYRGDLHHHSAYTNNPAERGHPLSITRQAVLATGLSWVVLADHSTDLSEEDYAQELREVQGFRDGRFVFIRGEEVTVSSNKPSDAATVHMVALPSPDDPDKGFPESAGGPSSVIMTGDGSPGSSPAPLKEALARIAAAGGFVYAAHPFDPISPLLKGGSWDVAQDFLAADGKQLQPPLVGLEPWNRATTMTADDARDPYCLHLQADPNACFQPDKDANQYARLEKGIEIGWRPLLQTGLKTEGDSPPHKVFLAAGSDAHGDFNFEATMDVLDFSRPMRGISGYAEDNALGKLSTVVYCPSGMGRRGENVLAALREGHSVLSNGPLLTASFDAKPGGSRDDAAAAGPIGIGQHVSFSARTIPPLQIEWVSSKEFGPVQSVRLIIGSSSGEGEPIEIPLPSQKGLASDGLYPIDLGQHLAKLNSGWGYIRLEARTRNNANEEFRCYTNPIWVRVTK